MADTLLSIVQDILDEMDSDNVNSISDTVEATQVAGIVRSVFKDIVEEHELPGKADLLALEGLADVTKPTHMKMPDNVQHLVWLKYDNRIDNSSDRKYDEVCYLKPLDFVTLVNARPSTDTTNYQVVMYTANTPLIVNKLSGPKYWTSFDDTYIIFDSYNSNIDSTLQASKTIAWGFKRPTFVMQDDSIPDLPENLIRLLYHQALAKCFEDFKTVVNPKAERNESRFRVRASRNKHRARREEDRPNYGRK